MSGLLERLRQQNEQARNEERIREGAKKQKEMIRQNERELKDRALNKSLVFKYAVQLHEVVLGRKPDLYEQLRYNYHNNGHLEFFVRHVKGGTGYIIIDGQIDGSVLVGDTRLDQDQKRDPKSVEKAFEAAYNNPTLRVSSDEPNSF